MKKKLEENECIDLSKCKKTPQGDYILDTFIEGKDYCNAETEAWIWSIGCNEKTKEILASHSTKFYRTPGFECIWLR